ILAVRATSMTRRSCRGRDSRSEVRPGPTVCGAWRVRSLAPTACRLPLQQGEDCLRASIGLRQGKGAGLGEDLEAREVTGLTGKVDVPNVRLSSIDVG